MVKICPIYFYLFYIRLGVEELFRGFSDNSAKVLIGGKNNVLNSIK
jgi:hypothetical protein